VRPVWKECFRVLRPGGVLLVGMMNPDFYIFDFDKADQGILEVVHKLPYADADDPVEREKMIAKGWPLEHSHTLTDLLGGQLEAGFQLVALYEDTHDDLVIGEYLQTYIATRAIKP
jgi:predicted SAM-dependent methyltransferase